MKAQNNNSNTNYQSAFFIVPSRIMDLPGLTLGYLKVFEIIFAFWNHNRPCYLSNQGFMERSGLKYTQLKEAFLFLERHGEIIRKTIDGKRYIIQPDRKISIEGDSTSGADGAAEGGRCSGQRGADGPAHNIKKINSKNNNKNPIVDFGKSTEVKSSEINNADNEVLDIPDKIDKPPKDYKDDQLFMQFYNAYPNKQKPASAHRAFKKLKPNEAFVLMLVADIAKRQRNNWLGRDKSKIPHPSTYLNAREWEGEIYKKSTTSQVNTYPAYKQQTKTGLTIDSGYF